MQEGLKVLKDQLSQYDWFYDVRAEARRYVVYVKHMEKGQNALIPNDVEGRQVVVHFASELTATRSQFTDESPKTQYHVLDLSAISERCQQNLKEEPSLEEEMEGVEDPIDLSDMIKELVSLEKICGSNALQDIFYEVHDQHNAVTNLSTRYPEVSQRMSELYQTYGFDLIYEELDG